MCAGVEDLVSYVSQFMELHAGDLILTGTPAGTGAAMWVSCRVPDPKSLMTDPDPKMENQEILIQILTPIQLRIRILPLN